MKDLTKGQLQSITRGNSKPWEFDNPYVPNKYRKKVKRKKKKPLPMSRSQNGTDALFFDSNGKPIRM